MLPIQLSSHFASKASDYIEPLHVLVERQHAQNIQCKYQ